MSATSTFWARLRLPLLLALLAVGGACYAYFAGESATLPVRLVPHLAPVPVVLDSVAAGPAWLPLPLNGYVVTLTHDVGGPYTHPTAAALWLLMLAAAVAGWLAVVSGLTRPAFLAGTGPVIFLLSSLNVDGLGLFGSSHPYFLWLSLGLLGTAAFGLHLLGDQLRLPLRVLIMSLVTAALGALLAWKTPLPLADAALQLAAEAMPAGAVLLALLVLWVGVENVRALLWFNTQADRPEGRFGLLPFLLASLLYLGALGLYWFQGGELSLGFGLHLDPLVLLLPAVLTSALGLALRAPSYAGWVPYPAARALLGLLTAAAAAALGYMLYTVNEPLLDALRDFSALALLLLGAAFALYTVLNFGPLIQQRLRVYRVVFEPRRLPFYAVYVLGIGGLIVVGTRNGWSWLDQVQAGRYCLLGDATRQQSEASPNDLPLALLAERYYAESGDVLDRFNRPAQFGRAALYRFRAQFQNEQNALRRALLRQPGDEKASLRLAALLTGPSDFLDALEVLRLARRQHPGSFPLTSDLAQLFTRSALTDSTARYLDRAELLAPRSPVSQANQLGFLLNQELYPAARKLAAGFKASADAPALGANEELLRMLKPVTKPKDHSFVSVEIGSVPPAALALDDASFAEVYAEALTVVRNMSREAQLQWVAALGKLAAHPANEAYYEQLLYVQSLLLHAAGQELAARQALAPLAAGTSKSAAYYQYVLGLWQVQQQQYGTAAAQFGRAAELGNAEARPAQAWALVLAGQPDSARVVARRLAASADTASRQTGQQLVARLATTASQPMASASATRPLAGAESLAQARALEAAGKPDSAARRYRRAVAEAPFNAQLVLAAGRFFAAQNQPGNAYEVLQRGLTENPDDPALLQGFALAAASAGVAELGQSALAQLRPRLSPAAYAALAAQFEARRRAHAAAAAEFEGPNSAGK